MSSLTLEAPAKINWSLDIVGKRADGYHLLKMVMQQIALADQLIISESGEDSIVCDGMDIARETNIAYKAWQAIKQGLGLKQCLDIRIIKKIPLGGGLAGGSADAAAVLKGANQLFSLGLSDLELRRIGLTLGADVPFCLAGRAALAEGIGEILTPIDGLPEQSIVLANPGIEVPTGEIFREFSFDKITEHPRTAELIEALRQDDKKKIGSLMANLLETVTLPKYPVIIKLKDDLKKLGLMPLMSGSGASVFGLAKDEREAREAVKILKKEWPYVIHTHTIS